MGIGANPTEVAVDPGTHTAYVTNQTDNSVSVIEAATPTVTATIPVGLNPIGVAVDPGTHTAYVTNYYGGTVSVIDEASNTVTATIPAGSLPGAVAVDPGTHTVYVANGGGTVSVIDEATKTVTATIPVGGNPEAVAVDPGTHTVYVAHYEGTVSVIDEATNTVTVLITVGFFAFGVAVDPGTHTVYATSNQFAGTVSVIDEATSTVTATIPVGSFPRGVAVDPGTHTAYVATSGAVSVIDEASNTVTATIPVGEAFGVAVDPGTHTVYATNFTDGTVSVISPASAAVLPVAVSGSQTYGSSTPSFTTTTSPPAGDTFTGTLTCTTVGSPAVTISAALPAGTYTLNGSSCSGLSLGGPTASSYQIAYNGGPFTVGGPPAPPCPSGSPLVMGATPPSSAGATAAMRAIEVNQSVQDWCDSIPLIAGKPTLVRVHLQALTGGPATASASLQATRGGVSLGPPLLPVAPGQTTAGSGPTSVSATSDAEQVRLNVTATVNFWLPNKWLNGDVRLSVIPQAGTAFACQDPTSSPSACTVDVNFQPSPVLRVTLIQAGYPDPQFHGRGRVRCTYPSPGDLKDELNRLAEIYPVTRDHIQANVYTKQNDNVCIVPIEPQPPDRPSDGSWNTNDLLQPGRVLSQSAHDVWIAQGNPDNRYFISVFKSTTSAWAGTYGTSNNTRASNVVVHIGEATPFQDPYFAARYEIGHELMHAMGIPHPTPWVDSSGGWHTDALCGTEASNVQTAAPVVPVDRSTAVKYAFPAGLASPFYSFNWSPFNAYPAGYAYALGSMTAGDDQEIWGVNTDAFSSNDNQHRIIVDPHHTFDMMSYCYGTYPRDGASKFQWITGSEYKAVLAILRH
jgi:YVTN family beta-propeller protein